MGISSEPKATQSVCVSQEILQSLDKCITLSRTLESLSFRVHLGEPAKEISKVEELLTGQHKLTATCATLAEDHISLKSRIETDIMPTIAEYKQLKMQGAGFLVAFGMLAGAISLLWDDILMWIKSLFK